MTTLDPKLLEILACPADDNRPPLRLEGETLVCDECLTWVSVCNVD